MNLIYLQTELPEKVGRTREQISLKVYKVRYSYAGEFSNLYRFLP
jgi:hypothetical protein